MKALSFIVVVSSLVFSNVYSQCEVNVSATPGTTIVCGESVNLSAFGSSTGQLVLDEDFNTGGFGSGWSSTPGATSFSNPCSPGGVDGTPHAWMDNNTSVPRALTSASYDLTAATAGVTICFDMLFAEQGDAAPCEGPDEPDEGVYLQYSIDGGATWIDIHYFDPNGGNDPQLTNWNNWCFAVPAAAITGNTMFQWYQDADSGADYDHWGIDNVQIFMNDINSEVVWLHDGYSYGVGNAGGVNPNAVTPTTTTTYTAQMTTGSGQICTADIEIVVISPVFDVNVVATPATICAGDCAAITGTANIIQDPGGIETYENNEFEIVAGGSASVNINVQGINTSSIYDGLIQNVTINGFNFSGSSLCTNFGGCNCNGSTISIGQMCNLNTSGFEVTLTSPGGCQIVLVPDGTATGNYNNTVFVPVGGAPFGGTFPNGGTWNPQESMSNLNGCEPNGVWTLSFTGPDFGFGFGTLTGWSITFDDPPIYQPVCASWSPATGLSSTSTVNTNACPPSSTNYTLTVSNCTPGCPTFDQPLAITVNPCGGCIPPNIIIAPLSACSPNTVDLNNAIGAGSDPATISFHASQADAQNDVNPISPIVATSGSYWVRAEDPADPTCFLEYEIVVTISSLSYSASVVGEACGAGDGQISLTANSGSGSYSYSIDGGSSSQGSGTFSGLSAGTFNILITDLTTGCSVTGTESITNIGGPTIDNVSTTNPSCPGACDGSLTANVSGGTPPYSYQWFDGVGNPIGTNSATINGLCAGNYSVEVSDGGGSTTQLFYDDFETGAAGWNLNVTMGPEGADANYFEVDDDEGGVAVGGCGIAGNGNATLHITSVFFSGGGAAYDAGGLCGILFCPQSNRQAETPLINTVGQTGLTLNFDFIAGGDIPNDQATVWYNDGFGWTQLGGPLFSGTGACAPQGIWTAFSMPLPASCENIPNLRIAIRWQNNDDGAGTDPSVAINNIEVVTSGATSCSTTQATSLTDPVAADPSFILTDFCLGQANGATGIVTPGGTFAYNPAPGDGSTVNPTTGEITNGVQGTTYTVEYTTPGACGVSSTETVTVNGISYSAVVNDENCGSADGEIQITAIGGSPAYQYSIDNGVSTQGSPNFSGLATGSYDIFISDANGCQTTGTEFVGNIGGPSISSFVLTDPSCNGICDGEISITVSGGTAPYSYAWEDNLGNPIGGNSATLSNLCAGDYVVTVTDANGGTTQLNTNSDFEAGTGAGCDCPTGYTCNNDAGQVFDANHPVYSVGNMGCVTGATNYSNSLGANGGSGYVYFYAGADNIGTGPFAFTGGETVEICVYYAGPQGAGPAGQNTANAHFSFGIDGAQVGPDVPVPTNTGWTQFCFTTVMTAGNHTFQILSGGAAQYSMWFDDFTISVQGGGGGTPCPATDNFTLVEPAPVDPSFDLTDYCAGDANAASAVATPGGNFAFSPDPLDGSTVDAVTGEISNGIPGSTYTVEYTTAGACSQSSTETVTVNGFTYNATIVDEFCGAGDGEIDLTVNGGGPNYDFSIDNGATIQANGTFSNLNAGNYTILITDQATGCTSSGTEVVQDIAAHQIDNVLVVDETCQGLNNGSIDVTVSGGSGNYDYSWDIIPDPATPSVSNLSPGTYTVTITDNFSGCTISTTETVQAGINCCDLVLDQLDANDISCNAANDGSIDVSYTGGTGTITILIDNGSYSESNTSGSFTNLPAGTYDVTLTDVNGCTDGGQITINEPSVLVANANATAESCYQSCDGTIAINANGGTPGYTYQLNGVTAAANNTDLCGTQYTWLVTDANGCSVTDVIDVIAALPITLNNLAVVDDGCDEDCTGEITVSATNAVDYSIGGVSNASGQFTGICSGQYTVIITDANGCTIDINAQVGQASQSTAAFGVLPGLVTTMDSEFQVVNNSFNANSYIWEVTGPEGFSYSSSSEEFDLELPPVAGSYTVCLIASNIGSCPDTLCQGVIVKEEFLVFVPNSFTPNGDEYNNYLQVYATGIDLYDFNMQIYNRWGEQIWETNDISVFWDGTYKGQVVQSGTYTWKIVVKDPYTDERKDFVGHVNVLR